jgi:hypothetical protein
MAKQTSAKAKTEKVSDNNSVIMINLDRPREVRFGHKALKMLNVMTGKSFNDVPDETKDEFDLEELEKIMYCGLQFDAKQHGETLTIEDMEDILDYAESEFEIIEAMNKALEKAFQQTKKQKN